MDFQLDYENFHYTGPINQYSEKTEKNTEQKVSALALALI